MYASGIGVERDLSMARRWYRRAAAQGNAKARHNLDTLNAMERTAMLSGVRAVSCVVPPPEATAPRPLRLTRRNP